jgi:hypothetical protein
MPIKNSLGEIEPILNPNFDMIADWVRLYLSISVLQFHNAEEAKRNDPNNAIRDENRNAILPEKNIELDGRIYYLSIKGCGAYEDMIHGGAISVETLRYLCHQPHLLPKLNSVTSGIGFILGESWMNESPYGAQGKENAFDELNISQLANPVSIHGAYICPVIGILPIPSIVENSAREFFWFRTYPDRFYQELRLVPSRTRLYFESDEVIDSPENIFALFDVTEAETLRNFELRFIRSGIALLTLFTRTLRVEQGELSGLIYQDVWFDKDCIVAPDGTIHFADLEGLVWKKCTVEQYQKIQTQEWHKLVFEFYSALIRIDTYRRELVFNSLGNSQSPPTWLHQKQELAFLTKLAIDNDPFIAIITENGDLLIEIEPLVAFGKKKHIEPIRIPFLEQFQK